MVQTNGKKIDHLPEDKPIIGQRFVCLSFVSPEGIRNCTTRGLKVRGVYATYEEAQERCQELQTIDSDFDIFIGEVGKWLPWDPDPNSAKDQKYQEKELQNLVDGYKKNLDKATKLQEERKKDMIERAAKEEQSREGKTRARLRKKLAEKKAKEAKESALLDNIMSAATPTKKTGGKKKKNLSDKEAELESKNELAQDEHNRLQKNENTIADQQTKLSTIDDQLNRIQSLYSKLKNKNATSDGH